ncbi:MAG: spermidine/putrescine ABC transporter substrate-binding protein [Terrimicrobiaceae bacterium]|nr:spermidine/putrescine ABC transporter substrate-binding protein [Terrimicrobiaceae bacterium]
MKTIVTTLTAALAGLLLAGCGESPNSTNAPEASPSPAPETAAGTAPAATPAAEAASPGTTDESKRLSIFCWSEYIPQSVIDKFAAETGINVSVENYASNEEMLAKLLAGGGNYDIIQPSEYVVGALIKEGLLEPIDLAQIPNIKNVDPKFLNMSFDPGNRFSIPFMAGTVGIVVNTDVVKDEIKGFRDVFQEKYKGQIVVLDDAREIVTWAFFAEGLPINDMSDENLEKVRPLLSQWLPLIKVFDSDSPKTALLNGDVSIGVVWGGEGAILLNEDPKFKWIVPAEGTHLFVDSLAVPKGAKHPNNAMAFMNFILRPDISKEISDAFPYTSVNAAAKQLMSPEQLGNRASFPTDEEMALMQTFEDIGEQGSKVDELVTSLKVQ